jgi:hypothetical protein
LAKPLACKPRAATYTAALTTPHDVHRWRADELVALAATADTDDAATAA